MKCHALKLLIIRAFRIHPSENGKYWFICDPCGIICIFFTYGLIIFGFFVSTTIILLPSPSLLITILWIGFTVTSTLTICSHIKAMATDPGSMPKETDSEETIVQRKENGEYVSYCKKCHGCKPDRAHHCSTCGRCIQRMDHHCPWINNCVGAYNQKFFVLFCFYVLLTSAIGLLMAAIHTFNCVSSNFKACNGIITGAPQLILIIIAILEGILFILFTFIMYCSQIYAIIYDETGIERLKHDEMTREVTCAESFREVFGGRCSWRWFSPFTSVKGIHFRIRSYTKGNEFLV